MAQPKSTIVVPNLIYVFECHLGIGATPMYYVGTTGNFNERYIAHKEKEGPEFTKKFTSIECVHVRLGGPDVETQVTLEYMSKKGIENVRGGPWPSDILTDGNRKEIMKMLCAHENACFKCGSLKHFTSSCSTQPRIATAAAPPAPIDLITFPPVATPVAAAPKLKRVISPPATWKADPNKPFCKRCYREGHTHTTCKSTTYSKNNSSDNCTRCGRLGHVATECEYRTDVAGMYIN